MLVETERTEAPALEGFRLSPQQERLWRLAGDAAGMASYAAWCAVAVDGPLNRRALEAAVAAAVERNELLRTSFRLLPGLTAPLQVVSPSPPKLRETEEAALTAPFELDGGALLRWSLVPLGPERHRLSLAMPSLLADAAGLDNLVGEIARCYAAEVSGKELADEPAQYVDLSEWQHELLESEDTRAGREYWAAQPVVAALELPLVEGPRPPGQGGIGFTVEAEPVAALAARLGTSGEEILLSVWTALLWRLAGRPGVVPVEVALDGRKFDELRGAPGLFARYLPLAARVEGGTSFAALVEDVGRVRREHAEWQEYFAAPAPEGPRYGFAWRPAPARHSAAGCVFRTERRSAPFDRFTAELVADEDGSLELRAAGGMADLLAERFATLLSDALSRPDAPLAELGVVGPRERRLLVEEWNATDADFGPERLLHRLVAAQAARTPGRPAVEWDGGSWTYAELEARAEELAGRLRRLGVEPEARVAVCLQRTPDLVAALLAVWKTGAAYVPLDPATPSERLAWLLEDARPAALIVGLESPADLAPPGTPVLNLSPDSGAHGVVVPPPLGGWVVGSGGGQEGGFPPTTLAYVLYTSGSTGRPKGVMVSHGAIANRLLWMAADFPLTERDTVLQKTPITFDASLWELFLPLLSGARLLLARPDGHRDLAAMARSIAHQGVTVLQLVPSLLGPFLDEVAAGADTTGLRLLFCGGEALSPALRDRALAALPAGLCNLYGPTECAIDATFWRCERDDRRPTVPIGRPVANDRVYVVDADLRPVPLGTPGELVVAGAGLARGYLGRPDLTAERFVPDPFATAPGGRLYRTGDFVRQGLDGALEFLGRGDGQVKLRGVRIEPGEVEGWLCLHPAVAEAAAAVRGEGDDRRLIAWFVARNEVRETELRDFLAARLPEAMIPASLVRVDALPRLASGKVDRAALPDPAPEAVSYVAPRTPTEEVLAARWAEVLGVERLGAHDNVFALGWHSLMATRFVSRLRRTFGVDVPLRSLFEYPTVAALAERIDAALRGGPGLKAPPILPVPRDSSLPLSFAQRRLWFLDQWQPGSPFYNIPMALRFSGRLDVVALARGLGEVARRHESLRTRFAEVDDEPVQVIDPPAPVPLPLMDLSGLPDGARDEELRRRLAEEALRPFDLARGPLLRAALLRLEAAEHVGLLTMHHIVSDGWSTGILTRELGAFYAAFVAGGEAPPALPAPPIQYADFAVWQRGWLRGEVLDAHLDYWRGQLAGAPPVLELPGDRPRPAVQSFRGATRSRLVPLEVLDGARQLARSEGATLFMVMVAAGSLLLGWTAGVDDLVVGTDVASRDRAETEGVIGFFINQLALRTRLGGDPTFRELLARVRESTLGAYAHQDLPFDKLVESLNPERTRQHSPLFQVKINLHNVPQPELDLPGVTLTPLAATRVTSQFDWILNLIEVEQGLATSLEHSTDLFDPPTADRMLGNFEAVLRAAAERPEARLSELAEVLAAADERQRAAAAVEWQEERRRMLRSARRQAVGSTAGEAAP